MISSIRTRKYFFLSMGALAILALVWVGLRARARNAFSPPRPAKTSLPEWTLRSTGGFFALDGDFFAEGGRLHVYSRAEEPVRLNAKTGMPEYASAEEWPLAPKGKPIYHEAYDLVDGQWIRKVKEFSGEPSQYLDLSLCDRADRLEVPIEKEMRVELPTAIKIKAIHKFPGYAAVIYSETSPDPLDVPQPYPPIEVDLLVPDGGGWRVADSQEAEEYGYFCATTTFPTTLADRKTATVLLVYTLEPGKRDDYYAARSFAVTRKPPQTSGK
jgi:hypothetical protein